MCTSVAWSVKGRPYVCNCWLRTTPARNDSMSITLILAHRGHQQIAFISSVLQHIRSNRYLKSNSVTLLYIIGTYVIFFQGFLHILQELSLVPCLTGLCKHVREEGLRCWREEEVFCARISDCRCGWYASLLHLNIRFCTSPAQGLA